MLIPVVQVFGQDPYSRAMSIPVNQLFFLSKRFPFHAMTGFSCIRRRHFAQAGAKSVLHCMTPKALSDRQSPVSSLRYEFACGPKTFGHPELKQGPSDLCIALHPETLAIAMLLASLRLQRHLGNVVNEYRVCRQE